MRRKKKNFNLGEWEFEDIMEDSDILNTSQLDFDTFSQGTLHGPIKALAKVMLSKKGMSLTYESKTAEFSKVLPNEMLERYRNCCHAVLAQSKEPKQVLFECRKVGMSLVECRSACALSILKHLHSKNLLSKSL